jgi:hypothetical protein
MPNRKNKSSKSNKSVKVKLSGTSPLEVYIQQELNDRKSVRSRTAKQKFIPDTAKRTQQTKKRKKYQPSDYSKYSDSDLLKKLEEYLITEYDAGHLSTKKEHELVSAIKHVKNKYNTIDLEKSKLSKKINNLMKPSMHTARLNFLIAIFKGKVREQYIKKHLDSLQELSLQPIMQDKPEDSLRNYYIAKCKPLQIKVLQNLQNQKEATNLQEAYKQFTTPLFFALEEQDIIDYAKTDLLKEFLDYVETNPQAITYVFSENIFNVLNIHLGLWRQEFNDGQKLMKNPSLAETIETAGRSNAINVDRGLMLPIKNIDGDDKFLCPCCRRIIGKKTKRGTFFKEGTKSNVDHTNPIGCAWINYGDNALCEQLVIICSDCNLHKSDTSLIEFFYIICSNENRYYQSEIVVSSDDTLTEVEFDDRITFYINNIVNAITRGVNNFTTMIERATVLKHEYKKQQDRKEAIIADAKEITRYVETLPTLFSLQHTIRDTSGLQDIIVLFGALIGAYETLGMNLEQAILNLLQVVKSYGRESDMSNSYIPVRVLARFFSNMAINPITYGFQKNQYYLKSHLLANKLEKSLQGERTIAGIIEDSLFIKFCESAIVSIKTQQEAKFQPIVISSSAAAPPFAVPPAAPPPAPPFAGPSSDFDAANALVALTDTPMDTTGQGKTKKKKSTKKKTYKNIKRR